MLGIQLINKPKGITSHDAVYRVRKRLGIKRVGHAGTLDPMGQGLLVMAVGNATRFLNYLETEPKTYVGEITLGVRTNTLDAEGEILEEKPVKLTTKEILDAAAMFVGEIEQVPPMFSAVKVEGQRLYKLARKGVEVERKPRRVVVHRLEITAYEPPVASFNLVCSGGTYARTLAADIGEGLDVGAHLSYLNRTAIGKFRLEDAVELDEVAESSLIPLEEALEPMPMVRLTESQSDYARNGQAVRVPVEPNSDTMGLLDADGQFFAVAVRHDSEWRPVCVLPARVPEQR